MKRIAALAALAALALAGCATTPPVAPADQMQLVEYETNSWGRVVSGWSLATDGKGGWWERRGADGGPAAGPNGAYRLDYHALDVGREGFARLTGSLSRLPDPAPAPQPCHNFRTDDLYGTIKLTANGSTREIAWNRGCRDAEYSRFMQQLAAGDSLVADWGRAAPVVRIVRYNEQNQPVEELTP